MVERTLPDGLSTEFQRAEQEELLDLGRGTLEDAAKNLGEMQRINDLFGGLRALTVHLFPRLLAHPGPVTLLDLGTGGAGFPLAIARWARKKQLRLKILAMDWSARNLSIASHTTGQMDEIHLLRGNALALPLGAGQVDYVLSSLFLHHLKPHEVVAVLRQAYSLSTRAVIMCDLVRGRLPALAFAAIAPWFARNYLTRHDGALSIRRAYTPAELTLLAAHAGLFQARVYSHFPWRMTLVVDK